MAQRLTRNQIIQHALDMVDSSDLDNHDRPGKGPIHPQAYSLRWLQDAIDYFSHIFPWAYDITTAELVISGATTDLPVDFIMDMRNGLIIYPPVGRGRLRRRNMQDVISANINNGPRLPLVYAVHPPVLRVAPLPDKPYAATLWYYALPDVMAGCEYPRFPSDWVLIEYIRLRGLEWLRQLPPGTAMSYAEKMVSKLQRNGFANEPEDSEIPLDEQRFLPPFTHDRNAWMGEI